MPKATKQQPATLKEAEKAVGSGSRIRWDPEEEDFNEVYGRVIGIVAESFEDWSLEQCEQALAEVRGKTDAVWAELGRREELAANAVREDEAALIVGEIDDEPATPHLDAVERRLKKLALSGWALARMESHLTIAVNGKLGAILAEEAAARRRSVDELRKELAKVQAKLNAEQAALTDCQNQQVEARIRKDHVERLLTLERGPRVEMRISAQSPPLKRADMVGPVS